MMFGSRVLDSGLLVLLYWLLFAFGRSNDSIRRSLIDHHQFERHVQVSTSPVATITGSESWNSGREE